MAQHRQSDAEVVLLQAVCEGKAWSYSWEKSLTAQAPGRTWQTVALKPVQGTGRRTSQIQTLGVGVAIGFDRPDKHVDTCGCHVKENITVNMKGF